MEVVKWLFGLSSRNIIDLDKSLMLATKNDDIDVVQFLLDNGADVHTRDNKALIHAVSTDNLDLLKCLVKNGADINAQDNLAIKIAYDNDYISDYLESNSVNIYFSDK